MPRSTQAKHSFEAGVRTPRVTLRSDRNEYTDRDAYAASLQQGNNWIVTPQGGIQYRQGLQNFRTDSLSTDPTNDSRIFQFHRGGVVSDIVVDVTAFDGLIHFRTMITDGAGGSTMSVYSDTVAHTFLQSELEDLTFTNNENTAIICHQEHPPLFIDINLDGSITGEELPFSNIPFYDFADAASPVSTTTGSDKYTLTFEDGDLYTWLPSKTWWFEYDGVIATGNQGNRKEYDYSATPATTVDRLTRAMSFIAALNTNNTTYSINPISATVFEITILGGNAGKVMRINPTNIQSDNYVTITNELAEVQVLEPAWSYPTTVFHGANYYQCIETNTPILVTNEPPNATYWTDLGTTKPDYFDWQYPTGNAWTADVPPDDRVTYSPYGRGFPTVSVVHQQRLWLMASPLLTMGMFGSRIGNYRDFILGPQDNDPVFFALDTSDSPTIKWAQAQNKLLLGTSSGDYAVDAQITITPSDVQANKQNNARSHKTGAVAVNTDVFYVQQGKEKMRMTSYNDDLKARTSLDISMVAQHLLETRVKRLCLVQTPETVIYGLREDGTLIGISYSPEQGTAAWFEMTGAGTIIDICGGYNAITAEDELWALVTYDSGVTRWIERMPYPARVKSLRVDASDDALVDQGIVCMDGWISGTIVEGDNNIITGLDQFDDLLVSVMVDDAWTGQYTVVSGAVKLDSPPPGDVPTYAGTYAVGFVYEGNGLTFEVVEGNPKGVGYGTKRRWNKLNVRLLNSSLPKINGQLPYDRHPVNNMGVAEIWREGIQNLELSNTEWGDGSITILQDRPYPCHILGFYGQLEVEDA